MWLCDVKSVVSTHISFRRKISTPNAFTKKYHIYTCVCVYRQKRARASEREREKNKIWIAYQNNWITKYKRRRKERKKNMEKNTAMSIEMIQQPILSHRIHGLILFFSVLHFFLIGFVYTNGISLWGVCMSLCWCVSVCLCVWHSIWYIDEI